MLKPHLREIRSLCRRYGVGPLRVFGSVARGEATKSSDVDILFDAPQPIGLLRKEEFRLALESIVGRRVDLVRPEYLKWYVRPQALAEAVPL